MPLGNSLWGHGLIRQEYNDMGSGPFRREIDDAFSVFSITADANEVFFASLKNVYSLDGLLFESPFAALDLMVRTVVDDYLYMSYRPSVTEWYSIYRIHTDGTGFEQLAADVERLHSLAVDPDSETIFYVSWSNQSSETRELLSLGFGETTPTLICQECAWDVDFVADDGFFLPGDTNLDRNVDITDFTKLLSNFGPAEFVGPVPGVKTWYDGDIDGDWDIDLTDFSVYFLPSFSATGGGSYGPGQSIPEPSTVLLLGLGGALLAHLFGRERAR